MLNHADLSDVDLSDAVLEWARLRYAGLRNANLKGANLRDADLSDALLYGADLSGAYGYTQEQLAQAASLEGSTMPNGQKYEDWLKSKGRGDDGENTSPS